MSNFLYFWVFLLISLPSKQESRQWWSEHAPFPSQHQNDELPWFFAVFPPVFSCCLWFHTWYRKGGKHWRITYTQAHYTLWRFILLIHIRPQRAGHSAFLTFFVYENWWNIRTNYKNNSSNPFLQHFHLRACQGRGTINHRSITREHLLLIGTRFYSAIALKKAQLQSVWASPAWQSRYLVKLIRPRYPARPKKCQGSHWDSTCLNSRISPVH